MADPLLPQDDLLASTMTHQAPKPNYAAGLEARISQAAGPSWLEQASAEHQRASEAFQQGGPKALLALDPEPTENLMGGFVGATTPLGRTFWSPASLNSALKMFNEAKAAGKGTEEAYRAVSEKLGRSVDAIKKKFVAEGVFTPTARADYAYQRSAKPAYSAQPGLWDNPENDATLETLFKKGMSFDDIARELKTSRGAVAGRLKRRGMLGTAETIEEQFRDPRTGALTRTEPGMRKPSVPTPSKLPMMSDADIRAGESIQRYLLTPVEHDPFKDEK